MRFGEPGASTPFGIPRGELLQILQHYGSIDHGVRFLFIQSKLLLHFLVGKEPPFPYIFESFPDSFDVIPGQGVVILVEIDERLMTLSKDSLGFSFRPASRFLVSGLTRIVPVHYAPCIDRKNPTAVTRK